MIREVVKYFIDEPFKRLDPPLSMEQMRARETLMMDDTNWREDHSVPSAGEHYRYMWLWDSAKGAVINARRGNPDKARTELLTLERYRDPQTGFLSNKIMATAEGKTFRDYPEAWTFNRPEIGSSYSQPPLNAWASLETYQSFIKQNRQEEGLQFLRKIYGTAEEGSYTGLQGTYAYFKNHRQNSETDSIIFTVHPNETGRDYDSALGPNVIFVAGEGRIAATANTALRWTHMQAFNHRLGQQGRDKEGKRVDWIPEQTRKLYAVNDCMFNVLYTSNLEKLATIASILADDEPDRTKRETYANDSYEYDLMTERLTKQITERMWNPEEEYFYNLDQNGKQIPVDSITGLFPLLLRDTHPNHVMALLEKLNDEDWFNTPYPLPTHAKRSNYYDPHYKRRHGPNWEGPVWIDMNHLLVEEGLVTQAKRFFENDDDVGIDYLITADRIATKTQELLGRNQSVWELYDPETGQGRRVEHFMWSNLGLHFEKLQEAKERYGISS